MMGGDKKTEIFSDSDSDSTDNEYEEVDEIKEISFFQNSSIVRQRTIDGYICVNDIVKMYNNKKWSQYKKNKRTKELITCLSLETGLSRDELISNNRLDRWIHPYLAYDFAQWIDPRISIKLARFVEEYIRDLNLVRDINNRPTLNQNIAELKAELKAENQRLTDENKQMTIENQRLTDENKQMTIENQRLTMENKKLTIENQHLTEELRIVRQHAKVYDNRITIFRFVKYECKNGKHRFYF